ncbi:MAG: nucleotidyltransferase family protein [Pelobium sp.]
MNKQVIETIRKLKPELNEKFNVQEIALFGSFARNEGNINSDLDILIKLNKPLGLKFLSLIHFLEMHLKEKVDLVTEKAIRPSMRAKIIEEAIFI